MTELLVVIRNIVLAMILGWFGLEFAPGAPDKDDKNDERASVLALLG